METPLWVYWKSLTGNFDIPSSSPEFDDLDGPSAEGLLARGFKLKFVVYDEAPITSEKFWKRWAELGKPRIETSYLKQDYSMIPDDAVLSVDDIDIINNRNTKFTISEVIFYWCFPMMPIIPKVNKVRIQLDHDVDPKNIVINCSKLTITAYEDRNLIPEGIFDHFPVIQSLRISDTLFEQVCKIEPKGLKRLTIKIESDFVIDSSLL